MLETSTETLSTKSPRPTSGSSVRRKFSRVSALLDELDAKARRFLVPDVVGLTMVTRSGAQAEMPQDQRQHTLADAAESDQNDAPRKIDVDFVLAHDLSAVRIGEG